MKIVDERETQKTATKKDKSRQKRNYSEKVRAK